MSDLYLLPFPHHPLKIYEMVHEKLLSSTTLFAYTLLNKLYYIKSIYILCVYYFSYLNQQHPLDFFFSSAAALFYVNLEPPL